MACAEYSISDHSSDPLDFKTPDSVLPSGQTRIPRPFTITTDSYISLCSRVYAACCSTYDFTDIPESLFQYYAVILLWKRFTEILPNSPDSGLGFFDEIAHLNVSGVHIPIPLQSYLKGIGHFRDPDGCDRKFMLPVLPKSEKIAGIPYTFGKVTAKTHCFYEAFPAPGVAALRMLADIKYTNDTCKENLLWDLPEGLHPDVFESQIESIKPTKNLLGWAPAQLLTYGQLQNLKSLKIDDKFMQNNFLSLNASVQELMKRISRQLSCRGRYVTRELFGTTLLGSLPFMGSLTQGLTIKKHDEFFEFDRSAMYCDGIVSVSSPYKLNDELNKGAVISGYRMAKEPVGTRHSWSCYDFNEYKCVPESWINTRNTVHTYGSVGRLNEAVYTTGHVSKKILQNECIQHTMFKSENNWNIYM